ncbi:MFS transporter [Paenarthrobacter sp. NPDC058040]|uniref:MFS transporter n=1 Tax=unclassified Paenarthrobacter TaxID=2634190 RepID=UPI0036DCC45B
MPELVAKPKDTLRRPRVLLLILGACFLMVMMDNTILNVALSEIQRDLSASNAQLQWSIDSYILVYAAMMFTAGVLADRFGRRKLLALGLVAFAAASALSAWAGTPEQLIFWRAVMGLGGSTIPPTTLAIIKESLPENEQGKALGIWAALGGVSVAFGPSLGGVLLTTFWWGSVFLINIPIALACLVMLFRFAPESKGSKSNAVDFPGLVLAAAATTFLVYGVIAAGSSGDWLEFSSGGSVVIGLVLVGVLVTVERRTPAPALDVTLFQRPAFAGGTVAISLAFLALTGSTFLLVFFVQLVLNKTPLELGILLLPVAVGSVCTAVGNAVIVRLLGFKWAISIGLLVLACALAVFLLVDARSSILLMESGLLLAGLGMGTVMGATTTLVMSAVDLHKAAVGGAINNTLRQVGAALGVAIFGSQLATNYRNQVDAALSALPAGLSGQARDSLGATTYVLEELQRLHPDQRQTIEDILSHAQTAFVGAMHSTFIVGVAVLLGGAVIAAVWIPSRATSTKFGE